MHDTAISMYVRTNEEIYFATFIEAHYHASSSIQKLEPAWKNFTPGTTQKPNKEENHSLLHATCHNKNCSHFIYFYIFIQ